MTNLIYTVCLAVSKVKRTVSSRDPELDQTLAGSTRSLVVLAVSVPYCKLVYRVFIFILCIPISVNLVRGWEGN